MPPRSLRLWPGVAAAVLLVVVRFVIPAVAPEAVFLDMGASLLGMLGGLLLSVVILLWWFFFSRALWSDRLMSLALMVVAVIVIRPFTHISIQNGAMGMLFYGTAPLTLALALVLWAVSTRALSPGLRRGTMAVALLMGCAVWMLARTDGMQGGASQLQWRWTPSAEERLLASGEVAPVVTAPVGPAPAIVPSEPASVRAMSEPEIGRSRPAMSEPEIGRVEWAGFRGPARDGAVHGVTINTNWSASPPKELWRRPIGPGWSSFGVNGDLFYTQEQRGDDELVSCYRVSTGEPVWRHKDPARFWESNGGAGPRGTPTIHNGRIYALGATGILNALDARTGAVVWSRNAATDTERTLPAWGFTSSPLIINDVVIVATSGTMAAYDLANGQPRWTGPKLLGSYSSPQQVTIDDVIQVLFLSGSGAVSVAPADGTVLWQHEWAEGGATIVQPAQMPDGDILINTISAMGGLGLRRLHVTRDANSGPSGNGWKVEERWTSNGLKPYFNDFVVHNGHAIGFDGNILASINLEDGKRDWKGGRYGNGQMLLIADQDLLLVISEEGELALVNATPDKFTEVVRFAALDGKTWNHPVLVGDTLLVRNGQEMAAFRLSAR